MAVSEGPESETLQTRATPADERSSRGALASAADACMNVSLIISTYNDPVALRRCLLGFSVQTRPADQIIVADDGSRPDTLGLLRSGVFDGLPIEHVWHQDAGWRKQRILNLALNHCSGDYVVFCDGDTIPRRDFLESHLRHARPRTFVSGSMVDVPADVHAGFTDDSIRDNAVFSADFLAARWPGVARHRLRLHPGRLERPLNVLTWRYCTLRGSNFSAWRSDMLAINGFDETFSYGSDDRELGVRLRNSGVWSRWLKYSLVQLHLSHPRGAHDPERLRWQRRRFRSLFFTGVSRIEAGADVAVARALGEGIPYRHTRLPAPGEVAPRITRLPRRHAEPSARRRAA